MAKDGAHYPSKKFKENYNNIFKPKKINLSPKTTKKFLEEMADEEASKADMSGISKLSEELGKK